MESPLCDAVLGQHQNEWFNNRTHHTVFRVNDSDELAFEIN